MSAFWVEHPRDLVRVAGPDAESYLQSQLSQDLRGMQPGQSRWTFLLAPAGRVDALARVWRIDAETFVLDTDAGFGEALAARLARFKIRVKADIESLDWRCIAVRGVDAGTPLPDGAVVAWGDGYDLLGESVEPPQGMAAGTADDLLAARIEARWPAMGTEIVPGETIPAELGINDAAVSFTKGCYPGQELVERMDSRGAGAPRSLVALDVAADARPGDPVVVDGAEVGVVTSAIRGRALALVKRSALAGLAAS